MKNLLIVDDQAFDVSLISSYLEEYKLYVAMDGIAAIAQINSHDIDLVLMDMEMPDMDGCETCYQIQQNENTKHIPVIFVTSNTDEASIEKAYGAGGVDYITKPIKEKELIARISTHLKLRDVIIQLEFLSYNDSMTNIYNRRRFFEITEQKFQQKTSDLIAVMIDIDNFKMINDTYGHAVGDKVIKKITSIISDTLPDDAVFGRIGGEEFAIVCHRPSTKIVFDRMEKVRNIIANNEVYVDSETIVKFTISIGVSMFDESMNKIDNLLSAADKALYEAKGEGRNKVVLRKNRLDKK